MGLDWETMAKRARGFVPALTRVPTRFNVFEVRGAALRHALETVEAGTC